MRKNLIILLMFFSYFVSYGQSHSVTVSGIVKDSDGQFIPGATIVLKGTTNGTISDFDGSYTLKNVESTDVILFSFIGFKTQEILVGNQDVIDVVLVSDDVTMDEVVVVGYGVQKKESSVAAISQVEGETLKRASTTSLSNALTGQVQGVFTVQTDGEPGSDAANVFIRGKSSWVSNNPLVLVDGVEGNFNDIDPNEIETLSVLKDASATAVFGVKGANGVILITTKRGQEGGIKLTFNSEVGLKNPLLRRNMYDSYETALIMNEAFKNDGSWNLLLSDDIIEHYRTQDMPYMYPNTDWADICVRDFGISQKQNVSVSGGSKHARIYASFSYLYDGDILKTVEQPEYDPSYKYNRYNYRVNMDFDITPSTVLSMNAGGFIGIKNQPNESASIRTYRPIFMLGPMVIPNEYPASILEQYPDPAHPEESGARAASTGVINANNPYNAINYSGYKETKKTGLTTTFVLKQDLDFITKGLSVKGKVAFNHDEAYLKNYNFDKVTYKLLSDGTWMRYKGRDNTDAEGAELPITPGDENITSDPFRSWYYEASISYARKFKEHNVSALFLGQRRTWQSNVAFPHYEEGVVGRVTYDYKTRYLAEVNLGLNGSEQFAPKNRYGFFPSYAVGWNLHQEKFMEALQPIINRAKIKYSYGEVGSDNAGGQRWLYTSSYSNSATNQDEFHPGTADNPGTNITPIVEGDVANLNATWERAIKKDLGIELGFLKNNMFLLTMDFFSENRDQILLSRLSLPDWFGVNAKQQNLGATETKGYEVELKYTGGQLQGLSYWAKAGVSFSDNRIIFRDEPYYKPEYQKMAGRRIDQLFGYVTTGYIDNVDERAAMPRYGSGIVGLGDVTYIDFNGDGNIDTNDEVPIGYAGTYPLYFYTFSGGLNYKGFDFDFTFQGASKTSRNMIDAFLWPLHRLANQYFDYQSDYWTPDNMDARYPALHMDSNRAQNNTSDGKVTTTSIRDASYVRLKTAQMGYTIPEDFLSKYRIGKCRIYLQGNNLFTWSPDYPIGDPEGTDAGNGNLTFGYYPLIRRVTLGLQVTF
ncbi:SusC/RagA family TonB-linked outer membrane protein [Sunxiuqinia sp. A32]|uniref:SusC/RagA family TonB-linked outer membrane protein n=1 Tax=Sunxiuqinia sp. A32 TaxID=3461496 RepID=UPI004045F666